MMYAFKKGDGWLIVFADSLKDARERIESGILVTDSWLKGINNIVELCDE